MLRLHSHKKNRRRNTKRREEILWKMKEDWISKHGQFKWYAIRGAAMLSTSSRAHEVKNRLYCSHDTWVTTRYKYWYIDVWIQKRSIQITWPVPGGRWWCTIHGSHWGYNTHHSLAICNAVLLRALYYSSPLVVTTVNF